MIWIVVDKCHDKLHAPNLQHIERISDLVIQVKS
jgi:hypothetical protein